MASDLFHGLMVGLICQLFNNWCDIHQGYWVYTETCSILNANRGIVRCPDIALMAWADTPRPMTPGKFPQITPLLVVEVLSPIEAVTDRARKKQDWFTAGLKEYWEWI